MGDKDEHVLVQPQTELDEPALRALTAVHQRDLSVPRYRD
jgi:hypothetical protein